MIKYFKKLIKKDKVYEIQYLNNLNKWSGSIFYGVYFNDLDYVVKQAKYYLGIYPDMKIRICLYEESSKKCIKVVWKSENKNKTL